MNEYTKNRKVCQMIFKNCLLILCMLFIAAIMPITCLGYDGVNEKAAGLYILQLPTPVIVKDNIVLVYELYVVAKYNDTTLKIDKVEIVDSRNPKRVLQVYEGEQLEENAAIITRYITNENIFKFAQSLKKYKADSVLRTGMGAIIYVWISIDKDEPLPKQILNRVFLTSYTSESDKKIVKELEIMVRKAQPIILTPPVRGKNWVCVGGLSQNSYHRRAVLSVDGGLYCSQRFATDFIMIDDEGRLTSGRLDRNKNYFSYGQEVLAVCDATVIETSDKLDDNIAGRHPDLHTLRELKGNSVILDAGNGNYIFYTHLQPNSLRVKTGDRVKRGQVIGLLGNSGNSDIPHLHVHVCDAPDPLKSEGLPYLFSAFELQGEVASKPDIVKGTCEWVHREDPPRLINNAVPTENVVINCMP